MKENVIIAVTGGIGSGKSTATNLIKELGYPIVSCDQITHSLYFDQAVLENLKKAFPSAVDEKDGKLVADKKKIAELVFNDKELRTYLTDYLANLTFSVAMKTAKGLKGKVFVEVPLLFECEKQSEFDKVLVIERDLEQRIESVMKRSNLTKEQVEKRINSQFNYENLPSGVIVIKNDGDENELKEKLIQTLKEF